MDSAADHGIHRDAPADQQRPATPAARVSDHAPALPVSPAAPAPATANPKDTADTTETTRRQAALARAAHALKTPLAVIKGSATTLLAGESQWDATTQRELLQLIDTQVDQLHHLLNGLLDVWRIETAQLPLQLDNTPLEPLLRELAARWQAASPPQAIHVALPADLPPVPLDAARLCQALDRLVRFAMRLAPVPAPIRIEARADAAELSLTLAARVRALAPDELAQLFEPLAAASLEDHAEADAGVAVARAIVRAHGGQIAAETPPQGSGLVFRIALPLTSPDPSGPAHQPGQQGQQDAAPGPRAPRGHPRPLVLLAGHPAPLARYLRANLEAAGYRPLLAPDMRQLARLLDLEAPDLVLLDASLVDASGLHALARLTTPGAAPVVVLGAGSEAECVRALDAGAVDYLAHPFGLPELLARLRAALRSPATIQAERPEPVFCTGDLAIDFTQRAVRMGERAVPLSRTEYKLLHMLAQHVGRVVAHELLLERVWGPAYGQEVEFLWVYVRRLRRKIEPDPRHPTYILTIPGVGYRLAQQ
jgi:DNA-binding response OmpR family regulator